MFSAVSARPRCVEIQPMEEVFLKQIEAEPDNRLHQLILSDWYEEQADLRAELIRMSQDWAEYKVRCAVRDWGMPGFDSLSRYELMEQEGRLLVWESWYLEGDKEYYCNDVDLSHKDQGYLESIAREDCADCRAGEVRLEVYQREHEFMPPGWIGHP